MAGPAIPFGSVYEMTNSAKGKDGGKIVNINHFQFPDTVTADQGDLFEFLDNWALFWQSSILPNLSVFYEVEQYTLKEIIGWETVAGKKRLKYGLTAVQAGDPGTDVGGIVTDGLPNYVAFTVQKKSLFAGRTKKGSMRIGGVVEADTDENSLQPAAILWVKTAIDTLIFPGISINAADTLFINWAIFSPTTFFSDPTMEHPATAEPRLHSVQVVGKIINPLVGSQTSRKVRN